MLKQNYIHRYRGFNIVKTGTKTYPWNIYYDGPHGFGDLVGCGISISVCKQQIADGCYTDDVRRIENERYIYSRLHSNI